MDEWQFGDKIGLRALLSVSLHFNLLAFCLAQHCVIVKSRSFRSLVEVWNTISRLKNICCHYTAFCMCSLLSHVVFCWFDELTNDCWLPDLWLLFLSTFIDNRRQKLLERRLSVSLCLDLMRWDEWLLPVFDFPCGFKNKNLKSINYVIKWCALSSSSALLASFHYYFSIHSIPFSLIFNLV